MTVSKTEALQISRAGNLIERISAEKGSRKLKEAKRKDKVFVQDCIVMTRNRHLQTLIRPDFATRVDQIEIAGDGRRIDFSLLAVDEIEIRLPKDRSVH